MNKLLFVTAIACLTWSGALAREDGSIEINYYLNTGRAAQYKLKFKGNSCTLETNGKTKQFQLSVDQSKSILSALQAEVKRYIVAPREFSSLEMEPGSVFGEHIGLEFKYSAPGTELEIELSVPFGEPSGLSNEMCGVIREHFAIDLATPKKAP